MCGICGIINSGSGESVSRAVIKNMTDALTHRGPDDSGEHISGNVGLAMRRLKVIDLDTGHQPIFNEDRTIAIVFNGEIYNFPELRNDLMAKGHIFRTKSDTEVIVHLYEEYGAGSAAMLNGMFAFALWDSRHDMLVLARDRMGQKPLYYHFAQGRFSFSSELKSLLKDPSIPKEIDPDSLNEYLTFEYVPAPGSIFKGIKKLPAAHTLCLAGGRLKLDRYWSPEFGGSSLTKGAYAEASIKLMGLMTDSVRRHLICDVPIGVFLSGGVDSSAISAIAARILRGRLKTFSVNFKEKSFDESAYSRLVSRHIGSEHHEMDFGSGDCLKAVPEICALMDEPFADASIFPTYILSKYTRRYVTVALGGDGGDELFAGYPTHIAHRFAHDYYLKLPALLRKKVIENAAARLPVSFDNFSFDFKAKKFISSVDADPAVRHQAWMGAFSPSDKAGLYTAALKQRLGHRSGVEPMLEDLKEISARGVSLHDRILFLDMRLYLQDDILTKTDRASMANSLEIRAPFLDNDLVDFANSLGIDFKLRGFRSKAILKDTLLLNKVLPPEIINRPKKGFGIPVAEWISGPLKGVVGDMLNENSLKRGGLFEPSYVNRLLNDHFSRRKNNRKLIWTLLMFELWRKERAV